MSRALNLMLAITAGFLSAAPLGAQTPDQLYFRGLRDRQLFDLAESVAGRKLAQKNLPASARGLITIELALTYAERAKFSPVAEQKTLFQKAEKALADLRQQHPAATPIRVQAAQAEISWIAADFLRWNVLTHPGSKTHLKPAQDAAGKAIGRFVAALAAIEKQRQENARKGTVLPGTLGNAELVRLANRLQLQLAEVRFAASDVFTGAESKSRLDRVETALRIPFRGAGMDLLNLSRRIKLVELARRRRPADLKPVMTTIRALLADQPSPRQVDELTIIRARTILDQKKVPHLAVELLVNTRKERGSLTGEMWYLWTRSLLEIWKIADAGDTKQAKQAADAAWERMKKATELSEKEVGGFWAYRCRLLFASAGDSHRYGTEVAGLLNQARAAWAASKFRDAIALFDQASKVAARDGKEEIAMQMGYTAASIELKVGTPEDAAARFRRLAQQFPNSKQVPDAKLLAAYALGRIYRERRKQGKQTAQAYAEYRGILEDIRKQYAATEARHSATWMLARLEESRLQRSKALVLYREIPRAHSKGPVARVAIARCYEGILRHLADIQQPTEHWRQLAQKELTSFAKDFPAAPKAFSLPESEIAFRMARIELSQDKPQFAGADLLLDRVMVAVEAAGKREKPSDFQATWKPLSMLAMQWRLVSLAGQREITRARDVLSQLAKTDRRVMLQVLDGLAEAGKRMGPTLRRSLGELQLQAAQLVQTGTVKLTASEQRWLTRATAEAYLATDRAPKAIALYEEMLKKSGDRDLTEKVARLLIDCGTRDCYERARTYWLRLERQHKPGTRPFFEARYYVAFCHIELEQFQDARRLIAVTKLLSPKLGGPDLAAKFDSLSKRLR